MGCRAEARVVPARAFALRVTRSIVETRRRGFARDPGSGPV